MKPGFKTTEFWLTVVAQAVGLLAASGAVEPGSGLEKIIGMIVMVLATMGYSVSRGIVKRL